MSPDVVFPGNHSSVQNSVLTPEYGERDARPPFEISQYGGRRARGQRNEERRDVPEVTSPDGSNILTKQPPTPLGI